MEKSNLKTIAEIISQAELTKELNQLKFTIQWDRNDADYLTETFSLPVEPDDSNLSMVGFWATFPEAMNNIKDNVSKEFYEKLCEWDWIYHDSESGNPCHSIDKIDIVYINNEGITYDIPLDLLKVDGVSQKEYEEYLINESEE